MSILQSTNAGKEGLKVTKSSLRARGFFHPKIKIDGRKVKDESHIWVNRTHFIECSKNSENLHFYLMTNTHQFFFPIENELDLEIVLKYCGDEKLYRYLRRTKMDDPRTLKHDRIRY